MHMKPRRPNNMNGGGNSGSGQHRHNNHNNNNRPRRFNNNRPQGSGSGDDPASIARTRRNSIQSREKYQMMARDALSMGDRVLAENYLQHADHYHRVILSLPPEEIRPQYLRPQHNQEHNNQEGDGQQQNNDMPAEYSAHENQMSEAPDRHAMEANTLPSFITQPVNMPDTDEQNS
jgi:hypothetical protein